jgi:hypothetical protein
MTAENFAFTTDKEKGTVNSALCVCIKLNKTNNHIDTRFLGSFAKAVCGWAGNFNTTGKIGSDGLIPLG